MNKKRLAITLGCYLVSSYGILMSAILIASGWVLALLTIYAWVAHLILCVSWIKQQPINWRVAKTGTLAGVACLIYIPFGFLFVFPCVFLAIHIMRVNWLEKQQASPPAAGKI